MLYHGDIDRKIREIFKQNSNLGSQHRVKNVEECEDSEDEENYGSDDEDKKATLMMTI